MRVVVPFGEVASLTGPTTLNDRFPGQWFQLESGLHYNWHRHYDPTTGRYLQPDPLGMPDGPSRWAYVRNSPLMEVDPEGKVIPVLIGIGAGYVVDYALGKYKERYCKCVDTLLGLFGNAAVGGIIGGSGPFEKKPRSGIAGGGRSAHARRLSVSGITRRPTHLK